MCFAVIHPWLQVTGEASEAQLIQALQTYVNKPKLLCKALHRFRYFIEDHGSHSPEAALAVSHIQHQHLPAF